jgi:hypothetical protein
MKTLTGECPVHQWMGRVAGSTSSCPHCATDKIKEQGESYALQLAQHLLAEPEFFANRTASQIAERLAPLLGGQYYHDLHCNASRAKPMGCSGCSCYMYQRARKAEMSNEFKYRVLWRGVDGKMLTAQFKDKEFAQKSARDFATSNTGVTIFFEDYEEETIREILCEVRTVGNFPLHNNVMP